MKLTDIIALARQGYKPEDIKELVALADSDDNEGSAGDEGTPEAAPETQPDDPQPESDDEGEKASDRKADEPDYKALYEKTLKDLKAAQSENVKKESSEPERVSEDEALLSMIEKIL